MGTCYSEDRQYVMAKPLFQTATELLQSSPKPEPSYVAISLTKQANNFAAMGKYSLAETLYKRALAIWKGVNRPGDDDQHETILGYSSLLQKTNRTKESANLKAQAALITEHFAFTRLPLPRIYIQTGLIEFGNPIHEEKTLIPPN